jgi:hypothetical protein
LLGASGEELEYIHNGGKLSQHKRRIRKEEFEGLGEDGSFEMARLSWGNFLVENLR